MLFRSGNDTLDGGAGDDWFDPGSGNQDVVIGGADTDIMVVDRSTETVVTKAKSYTTLPVNPLADGLTLAVEGVEQSLIFAGSGNDDLNFASMTTTDVAGLYGYDGNDYLRGGAGNDNRNTHLGAYSV